MMSPRNSSPRSNPEPGIYDGLLVVACAALIAGILFLALHMQSYGWDPVPGFISAGLPA